MLDGLYLEDGAGLMPEERRATLPNGRLSERLAVVETKVEGLKDDTSVIRSNIHGVNNILQQIIAMEQRCETRLAQLLELTKDLPTIAATTLSFSNMKEEIEGMIKERQERKGAWKAVALIGSALVGAAVVGAATASWYFGHVR